MKSTAHLSPSPTYTDVTDALDCLSASARGRQAIVDLNEMLVNGATGLDGSNQRAVLTLLAATFGPLAGSALFAIKLSVKRFKKRFKAQADERAAARAATK